MIFEELSPPRMNYVFTSINDTICIRKPHVSYLLKYWMIWCILDGIGQFPGISAKVPILGQNWNGIDNTIDDTEEFLMKLIFRIS